MFSAFFARFCLFLRKYDQVDSVNALVDSPEIWAVSQEKGRYFFRIQIKNVSLLFFIVYIKGALCPFGK